MWYLLSEPLTKSKARVERSHSLGFFALNCDSSPLRVAKSMRTAYSLGAISSVEAGRVSWSLGG